MKKVVKNKGGVKEGGDINARLVQVKLESVSKQIQKILEENGMGIQPFIELTNFGIIPRVRLVEIPKKENVEEKK